MMHESLSARLSELRQGFVESQKQIASTHQAVRSLTVRTESLDGRIRLTLNGMGHVVALDFRDESYQELEPTELSEKLVALFREAQGELQEAVMQTVPPAPFTGLSLRDMLDPEADLDRLLPKRLFSAIFSADDSGRSGMKNG